MAPPSRPATCLKVRPGGPSWGPVESAFGTISWVQKLFDRGFLLPPAAQLYCGAGDALGCSGRATYEPLSHENTAESHLSAWVVPCCELLYIAYHDLRGSSLWQRFSTSTTTSIRIFYRAEPAAAEADRQTNQHTGSADHTLKYTQSGGIGGGLEPTAANPGLWDLVPASNVRKHTTTKTRDYVLTLERSRWC